MPVLTSPTTARTLGELKTRIADELTRADLAPQIALAIADAIEEASTHRFWFMEVRGLGASLVAGSSTYSSADIANLIEIDRIALIVGSQRRTIRPMSDDEVDRLSDGTAPSGEPYAYSRYGDTIRFYPTPRQSYTVAIDGLYKGVTLNGDSDSNIWTDASMGERYVRALAKRDVLAHVIKDEAQAMVQDGFATRYRNEMQQQTHVRGAVGEMACNG